MTPDIESEFSEVCAALERVLIPLRAEFGPRLTISPYVLPGWLPGAAVHLVVGDRTDPLMLQYGGVYRFGPPENFIFDTYEDVPLSSLSDDDVPWVLEMIRRVANFGAYLAPSYLGPFKGRDLWYVPTDSADKESFLAKSGRKVTRRIDPW